MTENQVNMIISRRWPRMSTRTRRACVSVILGDMTPYNAEMVYEVPFGTVGRHVRRIEAEHDFCVEVARGSLT